MAALDGFEYWKIVYGFLWFAYGFPSRDMVSICFPRSSRFQAQVDEEWFFKTHIVIEAEGSHVVPPRHWGFPYGETPIAG